MKKIVLLMLLMVLPVSIFAQLKVNSDGSVVASGDLTAGNVYTVSDIRLKTNVKSLSEENSKETPLNSLMNVNVIKYNFKKSANDKQHYGVSAQELKEIYPDMVKEDQDGYLAVNYIELVPILIRSIQELKTELDVLQKSSESSRAMELSTTGINLSAYNGNMLYQNVPNPFQNQTTIRFKVSEKAKDAAICILDMSGKMLKKIPVSKGMENISINGYEFNEGLYLYSLIVNGQEIDTKKMVITK